MSQHMYAPVPATPMRPEHCVMRMRQQPQEALVTTNKLKTRKPLDPPPVVVLENRNDSNKDWDRNPNLFAVASLVKHDKDEPHDAAGNACLVGTYTSSCQRLKDEHGEDGAFFIFPDLSCRVVGQFRLRFTLFELNFGGVQALCTCTSSTFKVSLPKNFGGLQESSALSRTFADQGVKLRLRKENNKRSNTEINDKSDEGTPPPKRTKYEHVDDRKDSFPESSNARMGLYNVPRPSGSSSSNYTAHKQPELPSAAHYSNTELQPSFANSSAIAHTHDYWNHQQQGMMQETNRYPHGVAHTPVPLNSVMAAPVPFSGTYSSLFTSYGEHAAPHNARDFPAYPAFDEGEHQYLHM
jgi:hypothetical protein